MTHNQKHVIELAHAILESRIDPGGISDGDWSLLLLAADLHNPRALPQLVAHRVLVQFETRHGYFADSHAIPVKMHSRAGSAIPA